MTHSGPFQPLLFCDSVILLRLAGAALPQPSWEVWTCTVLEPPCQRPSQRLCSRGRHGSRVSPGCEPPHLMSLSLMTSMTGQATLARCRRTLSSSGSSHPTLHSTCESRNVSTAPAAEAGAASALGCPVPILSPSRPHPRGLGLLPMVPPPPPRLPTPSRPQP